MGGKQQEAEFFALGDPLVPLSVAGREGGKEGVLIERSP